MKHNPKNMSKSNWLNSFQNLSKIQKIVIVSIVFVLIFGGVFWWYRANTNSGKLLISNQSKNESIPENMGDQGSKDKQNKKIIKVSKSDYPSILTRHKSNPNIGFNLALNQNESTAVYGFDRKIRVMKKLYNYLGLPYRATNTSTKITNNFIIQSFQLDEESDQILTQISWTYFESQKAGNQKDYLGEIPLAYTSSGNSDQSKAIPENVIWYGFSGPSTEVLPTKDTDYGKDEFVNQGVHIYTKSLKDNVGTYLKDLKYNLDFKISDQFCGNIFFSKTDFWCLNSQRKLVNLTTNADIGEYSKITTTDQGTIYATRNINDIYSVIDQITFDDVGQPIIKSDIYQTKQGEIITYITYTNQQELLIQINRGQNSEFIESIKNGENLKELYTLQLQDNTTQINVVPRPEFDQFTVIL